VNEGVPRVDWDDLPPTIRDVLQPRYERLGYLPELFSALASDEQLLCALLALSDGLREALPFDDREVVALGISAAIKADYELFQHEQLCRRTGWSPELVAAVESLDPTREDLTPDAAEIVRFTAAVVERSWEQAGVLLDEIALRRGADVAVRVLMTAGYFLMTTAIEEILGLRSPVASIFDEP
jgi:alkylhydroperoxidase family enzyme